MIALHTVKFIQQSNSKANIKPLFELYTQELNRKSVALDYRPDVSIRFDTAKMTVPMIKGVRVIDVARRCDSLDTTNDRQVIYVSIVGLESNCIERSKRAVRDELCNVLVQNFGMSYADSMRLVCRSFQNLYTPYTLEMTLIKQGDEFYWGESLLFADIYQK